uniref:Uncharacterized protein n=1 Tax=Physcomitrium patens TaxID=3218 RepID=A0A7I3ZR76_PHYPA
MVGCFALIWSAGFSVSRRGGEFECGVARYLKLPLDSLVFRKEFVETHNRPLSVAMSSQVSECTADKMGHLAVSM